MLEKRETIYSEKEVNNVLENQIKINVQEQVNKEITVGYDYKYYRIVIKSCFIDGYEYFLAQDVIDFVSRTKGNNKSVFEKLRSSGNATILNKWEMQQGGFFIKSSTRTFILRDGMRLIIEATVRPNADRITWLDESIMQVINEAPVYANRELNYEMVQIDELEFDTFYQRKISIDKVRNIVRQFDIGVVGALIVSKRADGKNYVCDGQHRIQAMKLLNIKSVMAVVHEGLTISDEAQLFKKCNNTRKQPSAIDNYRADLVSGEPSVLEINKIVEDCGYLINIKNERRIPNSPTQPKLITAVSALNKVYKESGAEGLYDVLNILKETTDRPIHIDIAGMGIFMRKYKGQYNRDNLIKKIKKVSDVEIINKSRQMTEIMGGHLTTNYAKYVLKLYNENKQEKLEDLF